MNCITCNSGYKVAQNGSCIQADPNCAVWNNNPVCNCASCINGYILLSGPCLCVAEVPRCQSYNVTGCVSCLPPYVPINGQCLVKYCNNYSGGMVYYCNQCQVRFREVGDGTCYPKNCQTFNQTSWQCTQCQPRFQLVPSVPLCFTYNCTQYDRTTY